MLDEVTQQECITRLNKVEGQIKGIKKMVEKPKYCIDIINQITATKRALEKISLIIMKRHVETCVTQAIKVENGKEKIDELMNTIYRFIK
jgi:DNA-binding FrmR family transcriptional regulator